mmetsp:Transcript_41026/g.99109  ORF Transcript_41026/g.99109 Transcript_41026/m.99109 type:complete len:232 (-) Transcript_41026:2-697(-)
MLSVTELLTTSTEALTALTALLAWSAKSFCSLAPASIPSWTLFSALPSSSHICFEAFLATSVVATYASLRGCFTFETVDPRSLSTAVVTLVIPPLMTLVTLNAAPKAWSETRCLFRAGCPPCGSANGCDCSLTVLQMSTELLCTVFFEPRLSELSSKEAPYDIERLPSEEAEDCEGDLVTLPGSLKDFCGTNFPDPAQAGPAFLGILSCHDPPLGRLSLSLSLALPLSLVP